MSDSKEEVKEMHAKKFTDRATTRQKDGICFIIDSKQIASLLMIRPLGFVRSSKDSDKHLFTIGTASVALDLILCSTYRNGWDWDPPLQYRQSQSVTDESSSQISFPLGRRCWHQEEFGKLARVEMSTHTTYAVIMTKTFNILMAP